MNCIILCAGPGSRLRPITDKIPKCLVKFQGIPLLQHYLEMLEKVDNIGIVTIPLGYHGDKVKHFLDSYFPNLYIKTFTENPLLGSAGAVLKTLYSGLDWGEPMMVLYGDNYYTDSDLFAQLARDYKQCSKSIIAVQHTETTGKAKGVVSVEGNEVTNFTELSGKKLSTQYYWQHAGASILHPSTFQLLKQLNQEGQYDLGEHFFPMMVKEFETTWTTASYTDIGTFQTYCECQDRLYKQKLTACMRTNFVPLLTLLFNFEGTVWLVGNGDSCAIAQHGALDLTKAGGIKCVAFSDPSIITAYSNDISFGKGMGTYLSKMLSTKNIIMLISSSGESPNMVHIAEVAKMKAVTSIALTRKGSTLGRLVDYAMLFDEKDPKVLEDCFWITLHQLANMLEDVRE